jgi:hypothetical protein
MNDENPGFSLFQDSRKKFFGNVKREANMKDVEYPGIKT